MTASVQTSMFSRNLLYNKRFYSGNLYTVYINTEDGEVHEYEVEADTFADATKQAEDMAYSICADITLYEIMEQKLFILVKTEKSNRSENNVWVVSTRSYRKKYCRNALMALRYAFILKKQTGRRIAQDAFDSLIREIRSKNANPEPAQS